MRAVDILRRKRLGMELQYEEIAFLIDGFTAGAIPRYQMSAFLMAVCLRGMSGNETLALTRRMLASGEVLDLAEVARAKVDKHSTGGVGDKTSLVIAPLAASAGVVVPMISGRGLGHTGGTLDKLESIPGFDVHLDPGRFRELLTSIGCAFAGPTETIAPADRKLYALRDATATIDSLPLITASILSKKFAEGISGLVLDVKAGSGAFMKTLPEAERLGRLLLATAERMEKEAVALVTDMNQPLGHAVGNALEVREAIAVLRGDGPADVTRLSLRLTAYLLLLGGVAPSLTSAEARAEEALRSGRGLETFERLVAAQGGDPRIVDGTTPLPRARHVKPFPASESGFVSAIDTERLGAAAVLLGAGRREADDAVDPAAGLVVHAKLGAPTSEGEPLVTLHYNDAARVEDAERAVAEAYSISDVPPPAIELVHAVLTQERTSRWSA